MGCRHVQAARCLRLPTLLPGHAPHCHHPTKCPAPYVCNHTGCTQQTGTPASSRVLSDKTVVAILQDKSAGITPQTPLPVVHYHTFAGVQGAQTTCTLPVVVYVMCSQVPVNEPSSPHLEGVREGPRGQNPQLTKVRLCRETSHTGVGYFALVTSTCNVLTARSCRGCHLPSTPCQT
jgi:hypothetical protein